jgi:hypothetical protein
VLSRKNEYEADRFAAETIVEPRNLIEALKKLSDTNSTSHLFYAFLNYTHPPLIQRVEAIGDIKHREYGVAPGQKSQVELYPQVASRYGTYWAEKSYCVIRSEYRHY